MDCRCCTLSSHTKTVIETLEKSKLSVISYFDGFSKFPKSALVAFAQDNGLCLYFETMEGSRKLEGIRSNPHVAFTISHPFIKNITCQYEGIATELFGATAEQAKLLILEKDTPCIDSHLWDDRARLFKVRPIYLRHSDYSVNIPHIITITFK